ncbi:MAG: ribosomal protein S18-alanine N-acetyltransferase [Lachnospiraceae bacterium]|nr:ribosomal protein S18-alanine N-acetyltransferase [Lachnospiraceae bacterium]
MIRLMEIRDIEQVAKLERECFSTPWSEESLKKEIENMNSIFCVCEIENRIVGYAGMYLTPPEGSITNIAVTEKYRGRGIAGGILEFMFSKANLEGITEFTLEVRMSNHSAINLYKRYGFLCEGIRKNFYAAPQEDAYIMWKR